MGADVGELWDEALERFKRGLASIKDRDPDQAQALFDQARAEIRALPLPELEKADAKIRAGQLMLQNGYAVVQPAPHREPEILKPEALIKKHLDEIDWSSDQVDEKKAYVLACFSELTYLRKTKLDLDQAGRYDFVPSQTLDELLSTAAAIDVQALYNAMEVEVAYVDLEYFSYAIVSSPRFIIIAVRGTVGASDWLTNLDFDPLVGPEPAYHAGFLREAMKGLVLIAPRLRWRRAPVYATGHSLGGAIAAIMTQPSDWRTAYVFGAPRFGNAAATASRPPYAYVRPSDLVPHLPPLALGYADAEPTLRPVEKEEPIDPSPYRKLLDWLPSGKRFAVQHAVEGYRRRLGLAIGEDFPEALYIEALRRSAIRTDA